MISENPSNCRDLTGGRNAGARIAGGLAWQEVMKPEQADIERLKKESR
jgi:hypothetical protein